MKWHRIHAMLLKFWYTMLGSPDRMFDIGFWPILDIFIWGFTSFFIQKLSDFNILSMLLGGIILWIFVWRASQDVAVFFLEDFWGQSLYHQYTSPLKMSEHIFSILMFAFLRCLMTFAVVSSVAFLLYKFNIFAFNILFIGIAVLIMCIFGWAMGMLISSLIFTYGQRVQILAWSFVWIIQPFSCVFYPLSALPVWAQSIASAIPTTHVFENMRAIMQGNPVDVSGFIFAGVFAIILMILSGCVLVRAFRRARSTGLLARGSW